MTCGYFACTNDKGEKALAYVPTPGALVNPHFLKINAGKAELHNEGFSVIDKESKDSLPYYVSPKISSQANEYSMPGYFNNSLNPKIFIPKKYQKQSDLFTFLTNDYSQSLITPNEDLCLGADVLSLIAEKRKLSDLMKEELAKNDLIHYLTVINGQIVSYFLDANKAAGLGCQYGDMIISPEAQKHLEYLKKINAKSLNEKYLSPDEVQELFKKAQAMKDIPFGYKYDGCYARAHVMARRFEAMGIPTKKAWIKGKLSVPGTDIEWNYHVAPTVTVKKGDGSIVDYVIDPSLSDKAINVDEWVALMKKNVKGPIVKTSFPFPGNASTFQRTAVAISSSDVYVPDGWDEKTTEEMKMAAALQTMSAYSDALKETSK